MGKYDKVKKKAEVQISNLPLKKKILAIILLGILITAMTSVLVIHINGEAYKKLLYQAMEESLSYSSKEISDYMNKMENLSMMLLADETIQKDLTKIKLEKEHTLAYMNAVQEVRSSVGGYYQSFSDGILKYLTLYTGSSTAYTNILQADETPKEFQNKMIQAATEKDGAPCWITDYVEDYGLFMGRSVKQIDSVRLNTIGTILLNIDMDKLVKSETQFNHRYGDSAYVIQNEDSLMYYTDNLTAESAELICAEQIADYSIIKLNGHSYFAVNGTLPEFQWDYYYLVSYDEIEGQIRRTLSICLIIILVDLIMVVLLSGKMVEMIMVHIKRLTDKMQLFSKDNTKVPEVDFNYRERKDEMGLLHRQFDEMAERTIELNRINYVNEILKKEAQFKALENQINPHFLYNTLGSIKWRAKLLGEKTICAMIDALGTLLRTSLSNKNDKEFSIGKEMEIVESYITIQKIRFEDRLYFENKVSRFCYPVKIPKLTIQPLVENAIYYGLESSVGECHIELSTSIKNRKLHIYVKNTGSEVEDGLLDKLQTGEVTPHGHGVGLINIDKRIKIQFGDEYGLHLYNEEDYAVAELTIPSESREEKDAAVNHCG